MDELWNSFIQTGKIEDYLKYKEQNRKTENADENEGLDNKGTDYRGE